MIKVRMKKYALKIILSWKSSIFLLQNFTFNSICLAVSLIICETDLQFLSENGFKWCIWHVVVHIFPLNVKHNSIFLYRDSQSYIF